MIDRMHFEPQAAIDGIFLVCISSTCHLLVI